MPTLVHRTRLLPAAAPLVSEGFAASLTEAGQYLAREVAPRAAEIDEQGVSVRDGEVAHPPGLLRNIDGLRKMVRSFGRTKDGAAKDSAPLVGLDDEQKFIHFVFEEFLRA